MKQLKVIAPYLSIVGLIVLLSSLIVPSMAVRQGMDAPDWLGRSLAIAGAVLVLAWPVFRFEDLREILGTRQARYGGNALVLLISFLAILGVVNFFGTRYFRTWDLTENKQFTISNKTVQILEGLQQAGPHEGQDQRRRALQGQGDEGAGGVQLAHLGVELVHM